MNMDIRQKLGKWAYLLASLILIALPIISLWILEAIFGLFVKLPLASFCSNNITPAQITDINIMTYGLPIVVVVVSVIAQILVGNYLIPKSMAKSIIISVAIILAVAFGLLISFAFGLGTGFC